MTGGPRSPAPPTEEVVDGRRRRGYTMAQRGREVLPVEAARIVRTAEEATRRLGLGAIGGATVSDRR
ncbi:hypothetical protein [Streptomyces sp. NPDC058623]|uniref:hypothetical protein n=1 Tax=Streptomyces sp. NPDC058623 TaxID=3346563 RepID=UPI0036575037